MTRPLVIGVAAALLASASGVAASSAAFTAQRGSPGNTFTTAADWVAPTIAVTAPAAAAVLTTRTPAISGTAGNATGDSTTVVAKLYSGASATGTPLQTLNATRTTTTWTATAASLANGTYTAVATQADGAGNTGTSAARTFTVAVPPKAAMISTANGGTAGRLGKGDSITFTFDEPMDKTTVLSTFTGASASVNVRFFNNAAGDRFTILDSGNVANVKLESGTTTAGGVDTKAVNLVTLTATFSASTMTQSTDGKSFTIVLGTAPTTGLGTTAAAAANMSWTPKVGPKDQAGTAMTSVTAVSETDTDVDF